MRTISTEEVKKKRIKSIEKSMKENLLMDSLESYTGSKKQKVIILFTEGLLKERNWNLYCSSTKPGLMYKKFKKCGLWRKCSIHLLCMWCCWWNSCTCCFRMLKTNSEGVQTCANWRRFKMLYWKLFENWRFNKAEKWYIHKPEKVLECEDCKIL